MDSPEPKGLGVTLAPFDSRSIHIVTRGNVDGIVSSAVLFSLHPDARVSFVPSADEGADILRKDLSSHLFYIVDLALSPRLVRALNSKESTHQSIVFLDHHQQSSKRGEELGPHVFCLVREGGSAASLVLDHLAMADEGLERIVALADLVEFGESPHLKRAIEEHGLERLEEEARFLDFSWRLEVEDDDFRSSTGRRLSRGVWPSEIPEVRRRYYTMIRENRWMRACDRVRSHLVVRNRVGLLEFHKNKPSLLGFGTRALASVAREEGVAVAALLSRRSRKTSVSLRRVGESSLNLGRFLEEFTRVRGIGGGGHPQSAGAKIFSRDLPRLVEELTTLA